MAVLVESHFWQTGWFRLLAPVSVVAAAVLAGWLASRHRTARRMALLEVEKLRSMERLRLARDLHDDLGSRLTHLALLAELATGGTQPDIHSLNTLQHGLRQAIGSLDEIVWAVDPRRDTLPDLAEYLATTLTGFFQTGGIQCELENTEPLPPLPVPSDHRHHLLMAVREAAQNILKHSGATLIILHWSFSGRMFNFGLADNGCGFDPAASTPGGDGLRNMRERLTACGGEIHFLTSPGDGCRLTFSLPMTEQTHS